LPPSSTASAGPPGRSRRDHSSAWQASPSRSARVSERRGLSVRSLPLHPSGAFSR
jgi:hypothetical protein